VTNDADSAIAAARTADVAIVVAATTSGESFDRSSLKLDDDADGLIDEVAQHAKQTVVLVQAPGAVLMPWRDAAHAVLVMFLGGQETGSAWADVVFGDHSPTGRLPLSIPVSEADTIAPESSPVVTYSEGMATGYRNKAFRFAFPFGHGLTYSTFEYMVPVGGPCTNRSDPHPHPQRRDVLCISGHIRNTGSRSSRTIAQLYLELPAVSGHPTPLLKGFQKTSVMAPGQALQVNFNLSMRDLSYYSSTTGKWIEVTEATAHIGESSADIRQTLTVRKDQEGVWRSSKAHATPASVAARGPPRKSPRRPARSAPPAAGEPALPAQTCSGKGLQVDCSHTRCCSEPGFQCYQKNMGWATCLASCSPGEYNPMEEEPFRAPWSCKPLGSRTPLSDLKVPPPDQGEVVLRVRESEVPASWKHGMPIMVLGDGGQSLPAQVVQIYGHDPANSSESVPVNSAVPWICLAILGVPTAALLALWAWWRTNVKAVDGDAPSFEYWAIARGEALVCWASAAVRAAWAGCEPALAKASGQICPAKAPMLRESDPGHRRAATHSPLGSPTHRPLMW